MCGMVKQVPKLRVSRDERQAQTRQGLLDSAQQLFVMHGYGGTSIRDIADRAGYSQGAFYSNFVSKESLLLQLLQGHMQAEAGQLSGLLATDEQTPEQIFTALERWADVLNQDVDWCMLSIELQLHAWRSPSFAAEYQLVWEVHRGQIAAVIETLFRRCKRIPPALPEELAAGFMALAHGLGLQRSSSTGKTPARIMITFLRGLVAGAELAS
jgi:AcrR family transcriptional regulator